MASGQQPYGRPIGKTCSLILQTRSPLSNFGPIDRALEGKNEPLSKPRITNEFTRRKFLSATSGLSWRTS